MAMEGDEVRRVPSEIRIGEMLDSLSVDELRERVAALEQEIVRVKNALASRQGTHEAAERLFRS